MTSTWHEPGSVLWVAKDRRRAILDGRLCGASSRLGRSTSSLSCTAAISSRRVSRPDRSQSCIAHTLIRTDVHTSMSFWFKQSVNPSYTVEQINYYSVGISGVQIVSALGFAWISDYALKGKRWPPLVFVAVRFRQKRCAWVPADLNSSSTHWSALCLPDYLYGRIQGRVDGYCTTCLVLSMPLQDSCMLVSVPV